MTNMLFIGRSFGMILDLLSLHDETFLCIDPANDNASNDDNTLSLRSRNLRIAVMLYR